MSCNVSIVYDVGHHFVFVLHFVNRSVLVPLLYLTLDNSNTITHNQLLYSMCNTSQNNSHSHYYPSNLNLVTITTPFWHVGFAPRDVGLSSTEILYEISSYCLAFVSYSLFSPLALYLSTVYLSIYLSVCLARSCIQLLTTLICNLLI